MPEVNHTPMGREPDPSVLTTAALQREVAAIEKELEQRLKTREREDEANIKLLDTKINAVKELTETKFDAQVVLLDERFTTSVKALDAAFAAAKLAVDTAQLAADKAVDRERETSNKRFDALDVKYSELASRMDKNMGGDQRSIENKADAYQGMSKIYMFIGALFIVLSAVDIILGIIR
jgi:uncharacterized protein (DUF924 family)